MSLSLDHLFGLSYFLFLGSSMHAREQRNTTGTHEKKMTTGKKNTQITVREEGVLHPLDHNDDK